MLFSLLFSYFALTSGNQYENADIPLNSAIDNFTSCEEFLNNTKFDVMGVVDIDWKIFYFWNKEIEKSYHIKFHLPTQTLVQRFSVELSDDLYPPVDWKKADLFMETAIDFSALFIRTNVSGLYRIIPSIAFEMKNLPNTKFALKVVEPGYLGIMNCKFRLCYALAPNDMMPQPEEVEQAAQKIGFYSEFGRSHLTTVNSPVPTEKYQQDDDAIDDVQMEIEMDPSKLELF